MGSGWKVQRESCPSEGWRFLAPALQGWLLPWLVTVPPKGPCSLGVQGRVRGDDTCPGSKTCAGPQLPSGRHFLLLFILGGCTF